MLLSQFFRHVYLSRRFLGKESIPSYWAAINRFQGWNGKPILLSKLTADLLRQFLAAYRTKHSPDSTNSKRRTLLVLWRFAKRWGFAETAPPEAHEIPIVPAPRKAPRAWTLEEFSRLLAACCVAKPIERHGVVWDQRHWRALFLAIYDTGERLDALLQTDRADLSLSGHLTIRGENRKGKKRDIVRKLHAQTVAAIQACPLHFRIFPWPLRRRAIFEKINPILAAAGLPGGRRWKFHCGRRTSATQVAAVLGMAEASRHLDHSSMQVTIERYVDPRQLPTPDVTDSMERPHF